ncbi:MAG: SMC-Scp complex subunit ScpB [Candidatus Caldarchaeum sp.]|nr:SMC-Scp complex subunit ScpB [Candidatus Caldarchaeum sp.]MDW8359992.1 SMC-Scp complex subunit ScpB [Candidatus Caldarchaeum sp.]
MGQAVDSKILAEAILFSSDKPVSIKTLQRALRMRSDAKVRNIIESLKQEYSGRAVEIVELDDGRFYMRLRPDLAQYAKRFIRRKALPHGVLKTLATIAYYQPVPASSLAAIRGKDAYRQLKILVERGLVEAEKSGRTNILRTTQLFADLFGVENNPQTVRSLIAKMIQQTESKQV